jgi:hypothetical protein
LVLLLGNAVAGAGPMCQWPLVCRATCLAKPPTYSHAVSPKFVVYKTRVRTITVTNLQCRIKALAMGPRPIAAGAPVGALPSYHCVGLCGMVGLTIGGKREKHPWSYTHDHGHGHQKMSQRWCFFILYVGPDSRILHTQCVTY